MPGLSFAPRLPVQKFKTPWARKKKEVKSKSEAERDRKSSQPERQWKRDERLRRRAERREEEKQLRAERGEPPVVKAKSKRDAKSHHGAEQVDAIILKLLGKSIKSQKVTRKGKQSVVGKKKVDAQQETQWKPGMRLKGGERMEKLQRKQQRRRVLKKAKAERTSRREAKEMIGDILSDLLTSLPHSSSDEAERICDIGEDLEADLHWNPLGAERVETPDFPPTIIHPKSSLTPIHPKPSSTPIHPKPSSTPIHPKPSSTSIHPKPSSTPIHPKPSLTPIHPQTSSTIIHPKTPSSIPSDVGLTESSSSEADLSSDNQEERHTVQKKKYVKRQSKKTNPSAESSDEEEEKPIQQRRRKRFLRPANPAPSLTESSGAETPYLADDDEGQSKVYGELRGGAGPYEEVLSMAELMRRAIQQAQLQLRLDAETPGLGNCFSIAMVQQFRRPQVKLFLQSRGMKITSFMQLKEKVKEFVVTNMHTEKMKGLKANFEMSQRNMALENRHLKPRTWSKYWQDMLKNGEWADDTFIQACAWYTNMNIVLVTAGRATPEQPFYAMEGTFSTETTGPTLLVGYINGNHYQSLLPLQEDGPAYLAQAAIDRTLCDILQTLGFELAKLKQGSQVGS